MTMDSTRTIKGEFGEIWSDGVHLSNFYAAEAGADITYDKVKRSGTRVEGNKAGTIAYSGTITGYKVTSELSRKVAQITSDTSGAFVCELILKLADPESYGFELVRLKGVQFTKIDIMKFDHGAIVEQQWPFVFDGFEYLTPIVAK
jgi:hypothetical protein